VSDDDARDVALVGPRGEPHVGHVRGAEDVGRYGDGAVPAERRRADDVDVVVARDVGEAVEALGGVAVVARGLLTHQRAVEADQRTAAVAVTGRDHRRGEVRRIEEVVVAGEVVVEVAGVAPEELARVAAVARLLAPRHVDAWIVEEVGDRVVAVEVDTEAVDLRQEAGDRLLQRPFAFGDGCQARADHQTSSMP